MKKGVSLHSQFMGITSLSFFVLIRKGSKQKINLRKIILKKSKIIFGN